MTDDIERVARAICRADLEGDGEAAMPLAQIRREAIEEAAKHVEDRGGYAALHIAQTLRALAEKPR